MINTFETQMGLYIVLSKNGMAFDLVDVQTQPIMVCITVFCVNLTTKNMVKKAQPNTAHRLSQCLFLSP